MEEIDRYEKIVNFSHSQIENVEKFYKRIFWGIAIIVSISIFCFTFLSFKSYKDLKEDLKEVKSELTSDVDMYKEKVSDQIELMNNNIQNQINNDLLEVRKEMQIKIQKEFDQENIVKLVKDKASERVDLTADALIEQQISSKIQPQLNENTKKSEQLNLLYYETSEQLLVLQFNLYKSMALNDNRLAYEQIYDWSLQPNFVLVMEAKQAVKEIIKEYKDPVLFRTGGAQLYIRSEIDKLDIQHIKSRFNDASREEKTNLIEVLLNNEDIEKNQKTEFLLTVVKEDPSLKVVTFATKRIIKLYGLNFGYLEIKNIISWGEKNILK